MMEDWRKFKIWKDTSREEFESAAWQDKNSIIHVRQLEAALEGVVSPDLFREIEAGLRKVGMSIRVNPYIVGLIDWSQAETDPIRRQFLPMELELEADHPCLVVDLLEEQDHSPVQSLVHRYPDKVLFLVTAVCPVYCQYCTRSYAVGMDTPLVQKEHVTSAKNWAAALDYIRSHPAIEDIVVSGGDLSRLKAAHVRELGNALLDIDHVRRIRFATKAVSVQPMNSSATKNEPAPSSRSSSAAAPCSGRLHPHALQSSQRSHADGRTRDAGSCILAPWWFAIRPFYCAASTTTSRRCER